VLGGAVDRVDAGGVPVSVLRRSSGLDLPKSEVFEILRNERRRYLLHYLKTYDAPVELGDLATRIAAWEHDEPVEAVTSDERKRVYTTLQQTHLPKLDEAQIVEYDRDRGLVDRTEHTDELNVYLEIVDRNEFPWREYYLALGAVTLGLVTALWVDIAPLTALPDLAWMALSAGTLFGSATLHVYTERGMRLGGEDLPEDLRGGDGPDDRPPAD
jgi:hypothetical protein